MIELATKKDLIITKNLKSDGWSILLKNDTVHIVNSDSEAITFIRKYNPNEPG